MKTGYVFGLFVTLFLLLRPSLSHGQFRGGMMGIGGGRRGMGGGMIGMSGGLSPLQLQLLAEFGAMPVNGMGGMMGMGGGMIGQGGGMMGMGSMMGMGGQGGGGISPLQLQLLAEFGAVPVNGMGGMIGFAGKGLSGFNGGKGL